MIRRTKRFRRTRRGDFELRVPDNERRLLRSLPGQLRDLMQADDPSIERLFPPAYADDPARNAEYAALVRDDLRGQRLISVALMEATIDARRLDEEQLSAWLSTVNDLRLVLGTRLEVTEEMYGQVMPDEDPRAPDFALFSYLSWLEEEIVEAMDTG